jgi:hypothetical protein
LQKKGIDSLARITPNVHNHRDLFQKTYGKLDKGVQVHPTLPQLNQANLSTNKITNFAKQIEQKYKDRFLKVKK